MPLRFIYILFILCFLITAPSCRSKRGPKEYIEKNGLHSDDKPSVIANEIGKLGRKQQKAYKKQLKRAKKDYEKRNRRKARGAYFENK